MCPYERRRGRQHERDEIVSGDGNQTEDDGRVEQAAERVGWVRGVPMKSHELKQESSYQSKGQDVLQARAGVVMKRRGADAQQNAHGEGHAVWGEQLKVPDGE